MVPPTKKAKGLAAILEKMPKRASVSTLTPTDLVDREFNTYMDLPLEESTCDPLDWWRNNFHKFPPMLQLENIFVYVEPAFLQNEHSVQEV